MINFGTGIRKKTVGHGEFYCPRCDTRSKYERKKIRNLFTLGTLPFLETDADEFIQCAGCHTTFELSILNAKQKPAPPTPAQLVASLKDCLEGGVAVEYMVRDLTASGLDRTSALKNVDEIIGTERHLCKSCGLTYAATIDACSECQSKLEPVTRK